MDAAVAAVEKARQYASTRLTVLSNRMKWKLSAPSHPGLTVLSHRLTKELSAAAEPTQNGARRSRSGNLIFSPLSIHSALSVVALGAQGSALSEPLDVLGAKTREVLADNVRGMMEGARTGGPRLAYASGLWHHATRKLKRAYRDASAASCRAVVRAV